MSYVNNMSYVNTSLVFCHICTPFVRESLKESVILSRTLGASDSTCWVNHYDSGSCHFGFHLKVNYLMMKWDSEEVKLTNDSRRKLLKQINKS